MWNTGKLILVQHPKRFVLDKLLGQQESVLQVSRLIVFNKPALLKEYNNPYQITFTFVTGSYFFNLYLNHFCNAV